MTHDQLNALEQLEESLTLREQMTAAREAACRLMSDLSAGHLQMEDVDDLMGVAE